MKFGRRERLWLVIIVILWLMFFHAHLIFGTRPYFGLDELPYVGAF